MTGQGDAAPAGLSRRLRQDYVAIADHDVLVGRNFGNGLPAIDGQRKPKQTGHTGQKRPAGGGQCRVRCNPVVPDRQFKNARSFDRPRDRKGRPQGRHDNPVPVMQRRIAVTGSVQQRVKIVGPSGAAPDDLNLPQTAGPVDASDSAQRIEQQCESRKFLPARLRDLPNHQHAHAVNGAQRHIDIGLGRGCRDFGLKVAAHFAERHSGNGQRSQVVDQQPAVGIDDIPPAGRFLAAQGDRQLIADPQDLIVPSRTGRGGGSGGAGTEQIISVLA
jgi:hypothetical protein